MRKLMTIIIACFCAISLFGQDRDSTMTAALTEAQRDSIISQIGINTQFLAATKTVIGRYKVYPTTNTYNSLKLDTATGQVWALQIGMNKDASRMEYKISDAVIDDGSIIGRFELYPTNNSYNFILLDTAGGYAYQVQWSTKSSECGRWMIW